MERVPKDALLPAVAGVLAQATPGPRYVRAYYAMFTPRAAWWGALVIVAPNVSVTFPQLVQVVAASSPVADPALLAAWNTLRIIDNIQLEDGRKGLMLHVSVTADVVSCNMDTMPFLAENIGDGTRVRAATLGSKVHADSDSTLVVLGKELSHMVFALSSVFRRASPSAYTYVVTQTLPTMKVLYVPSEEAGQRAK